MAPREPVERLRALADGGDRPLGSLFDMDRRAGRLPARKPTAPLDPKKGVRIAAGRVQLGLTVKEIAAVKERIGDLLADVDAGKLKVVTPN